MVAWGIPRSHERIYVDRRHERRHDNPPRFASFRDRSANLWSLAGGSVIDQSLIEGTDLSTSLFDGTVHCRSMLARRARYD